MKIKNAVLSAIPILLTLWSANVHASWYQIEVIVFDYLYANTDGEKWYVNPGLPERANSIELIEAMEEDIHDASTEGSSIEELATREEKLPYKELAEDFHRLDGVQHVLKLSREYRPLLHVAWQQPGLNPRVARAVHLQQFEEPIEEDMDKLDDAEPFDIDSLQNEGLEQDSNYQVLDLMFDGTIRLRSSRFLHLDIDMAYFPEYTRDEENQPIAAGASVVEQRADYVRLQESRKIKLNEIHYFDHPLFGVIVRVSRLNLN